MTKQTDEVNHAIESEAEAVDPIFGIEIHGLDPIPVEHRHGEPRELFWTWLGGNFNYVVLASGAFTILFGLNIWQAIAAAVIGSVIGALIFGFCGIFGPRTATATIVNTRAAFGLNGNFPAALISWLSASGWVAVNSVLAVFALVQLAGVAGLGTGLAVQIAAVVIVIIAQVGIALFGHATVVASEQIFAIVSVILILGLMVFALPKVNWAYPQAKTMAGSTTLGTWFLALSVIMAGPLSWVNYASDYSRYLPTNTSWKRIALMSALGVGVAAVFGSLIGTVLATDVDMSNPIANLPKILPGWNWSALLVYLVGILAALAVANSTLWSSPISTQALGGADLSLFAGLIVTGILYYLVVRRQVAKVQAESAIVPPQGSSVVE